jgi:phosphoglycolate phosphatase-like HAD superfamily hydrolase
MRLTEFFDVVVAAQDAQVKSFKPSPLGIVETLRRLETSPAHALYVGDRHDIDGTAARAAGVPCVIVGSQSNPSVSEGWIPVSNYSDLHTMLFHRERDDT